MWVFAKPTIVSFLVLDLLDISQGKKEETYTCMNLLYIIIIIRKVLNKRQKKTCY